MKKYKENMVNILTVMKRKRSIIQPNDGFVDQLKKLERDNKIGAGLEVRLKKISCPNYELNSTISRQDERHTKNLLSVNKNIYNHTKNENENYNVSKSIEPYNSQKRKTLSRESKEFLNTLKVEKDISKSLYKDNLGKMNNKMSNLEQIVGNLKNDIEDKGK